MKELIMGLALMLVFTIFLFFQHDSNLHQEKEVELKALAQEAAAAAAQYFDREEYGNGYYEFVETEGTKAATDVIKAGLRLDDGMRPTNRSYWRNVGQITFDIQYIDHSEFSSFPQNYSYVHPRGDLDLVLFGPSVIVTIHTGKANYTSIPINIDSHQIGIHTHEE